MAKAKSTSKQQVSMFDTLPEIKASSKPKPVVGSTKKIAIDNSYQISGETGLNSVWREFGDFIENKRNNKTI